jgi:hypothetical protein
MLRPSPSPLRVSPGFAPGSLTPRRGVRLALPDYRATVLAARPGPCRPRFVRPNVQWRTPPWSHLQRSPSGQGAKTQHRWSACCQAPLTSNKWPTLRSGPATCASASRRLVKVGRPWPPTAPLTPPPGPFPRPPHTAHCTTSSPRAPTPDGSRVSRLGHRRHGSACCPPGAPWPARLRAPRLRSRPRVGGSGQRFGDLPGGGLRPGGCRFVLFTHPVLRSLASTVRFSRGVLAGP